jgi:ubiquinone/menaquinone biosynthesis C-methylase UbiE
LKLYEGNNFNDKEIEILVAGCGTGRHAIEAAASRYESSKILAIDLSLSSLAYAKRKCIEYGIQNIEFLQADILSLSMLNRKFDVIESVGVLHHMHDPMAGWTILRNCLKPGGLMKIGLYSEVARADIVKIREEIDNSGIGDSPREVRSIRDLILKSDKEHHKAAVRRFIDFYTMSEVRDLLFHVKEHRFTISEITECLSELGLTFCGFEVDDHLASNFKLKYTKPSDLFNLDYWRLFEEEVPHAFASMYQFWCQDLSSA